MSNKKFTQFLTMGVSSVIFVAATISVSIVSSYQAKSYDMYISKPIDIIKSILHIDNSTKEKYKSFIEKDKAIIQSLDIPEKYKNVDVIIRDNTKIDQLFYPLMKLGHKFVKEHPITLQQASERYKANSANFNFSSYPENNHKEDYIFLGINCLESKESKTIANIYKALDNNQEQLTSFIYFHEYGHSIAKNINQESSKTQLLIKNLQKLNF